MIKIGFVTDIHHSTVDSGTKLCTRAIDLLHAAISRFNDKEVDIVISGGDEIEEIDAVTDAALMQDMFDEYELADAPHQHVPGNHDIRNIGIEGMETVFGAGSFTSRSMDLNGFHLVFFCPIAETGPYTFTTDELNWLEADLAGTELPTIVITHVPINAGSLEGNGYFAAGGNGEWTNGAAAAALIEDSTTILVLQGHTHWNSYHCEDDIHYLTVPSLTEARRTSPDPSASSAIIEVSDDKITVKVNGRDNMTYKLRRRIGSAVWA